MIKYHLDEQVKQINLFDERFYNIDGRDIFNVTGWLEAFPKGAGFKKWLMETKDPDAIRDEAAQIGSEVHGMIEDTLKGQTIKWIEGQTKLETWEKYLAWCRFWKDLNEDPKATLDLKLGRKSVTFLNLLPDFTEFVAIGDNYAGTVDKMISIKLSDGSTLYYLLDWKTSSSIYDTAHLQISAYAKAIEKKFGIVVSNCYIVQTNPNVNKKGYKVAEVKNIDAEFNMFRATQRLYLRAFGEPRPKYKSYPTEVDLDFIKNNPIIKEA